MNCDSLSLIVLNQLELMAENVWIIAIRDHIVEQKIGHDRVMRASIGMPLNRGIITIRKCVLLNLVR